MVTACKKNNLTLKKKKKDRERHRDWSSFPAQIHYSNMTFLLPLPLQKWYLHEFCQTGSLVGTFSKKKKKRRGEELLEVPQTILVLALFLFSIIEMNWILRAEKECGVGGSCGVRIVSFCVSSPFFGQNGAYMRDRHKRTSALWMSACVRERQRECLGVCIAFHVHCVVPCPCQAPHTDQTLSLSGSAGCRDRAGKLHIKKRLVTAFIAFVL